MGPLASEGQKGEGISPLLSCEFRVNKQKETLRHPFRMERRKRLWISMYALFAVMCMILPAGIRITA
jgi:hypothetical protein